MTRYESISEAEHPWLLPGEIAKKTFDGDLDFCQANAYETSRSESPGASGSPSDPSPEDLDQEGGADPPMFGLGRSAKKAKAQLGHGPLVSFLAAAGNTLHGRATQEPSDPPRSHSRHVSDKHHTHQSGRSHTRSHTHPFNEPCTVETSSVSPNSESAEAARIRVVLTNFRVCSLVRSPLGQEAIGIEVALSSIAAITLQDHRINIALKFDSPQYVIAQDPHGPPTLGEIMSCLRRSVFNDKVMSWFPYQMGQYLLEQSRKTQSEENSGPRRTRLRTAEEIITLPTRSKRKAPLNNCQTEATEEECGRQVLGWTGGYDILSEFRRLKFDETLWSVATLNEDFELSPTYPKHFIMPTGFLQQGGSFPLRDHTVKGASTAASRYTGSQHEISTPGSPGSIQSYGSNACPEDELYIRTVLNTAAKEYRRAQGTARCTPKLCIMDARAYTSAMANAYVGGGRENPDHYPNASISFMSLGNIHVIASSHQAVLKAVSAHAESTSWHTLIDSTGWPGHVADLLRAASGRDGIVGKMLDANCSVLVHCTDGWDRTTQLVSLAQILMDPYYRTINGLRILIEKEWLSSGHPFQARTGAVQSQKKANPSTSDDELIDSPAVIIHSTPNGARESLSFPKKWIRKSFGDAEPRLSPKPIPPFSYHMDSQPTPVESSRQSRASVPPVYPPSSTPAAPSSPSSQQQHGYTPVQTVAPSPSPVFLLFLTCLHHIVQQHPSRFEYNDYLLVVLARAAGGFSPFGDFLYNNERERAQGKLRQQTPSIWKWVQENQGWFTNRDYVSEADQRPNGTAHDWRQDVLQVQTGGPFTSLWNEYYFNVTPPWYPSPRTVLSSAPTYHTGFEGWCPLLSSSSPSSVLHHQMTLLRDPLYSSQFEEKQLKQLVFPGISTNVNHSHQVGSVAVTMPPALALLKGEDMRLYYSLVEHLRAKRKVLLQRAFRKWREWARTKTWPRKNEWVVPELGQVNLDNGKKLAQVVMPDAKFTPEVNIMMEGGIESVIGGILVGEPFFGKGEAVCDTKTDHMKPERQVTDNDNEGQEDGLGGAFDDFGFPVDGGVFVAV
ncbi:hypothetical protein BGX34_003952 [Mortierella sp. NVP85]|nr:hypothetical protein BGX34_003952 [Mortierella sp. NVP85]